MFLSSPIILKVKKTRRSVLEVLERANDTFVGNFSVCSIKILDLVIIDKKNKSMTTSLSQKIK